jgi:uracil-DNA glycosylase
MTLDQLRTKILKCRKCESIFSNRYVDPIKKKDILKPKPLASSPKKSDIMLVGQAPGLSEYYRSKGFQGQTGKEIRSIFNNIGVSYSQFDDLVFQTAVTKCFPGRKAVKSKKSIRVEDYRPSMKEISNCIPFLEQQIELVSPDIIVLLGKMAITALRKLKNTTKSFKLDEFVGSIERWKGISVVYFPHTSGASRWLNDPNHKELFLKAQNELKRELRKKGLIA